MMKCLVLLSMVAACLAGDITPGSPVRQCDAQDLECPVFTSVSVNPKYEVRRYAPARWVSTTTQAVSVEDYNSGDMFNKLFSYISGKNDKNQKVAMTAPVLTKVIPGSGPNCDTTFTMSFYVPKALWGSTPVPSADDVFLQNTTSLTVFVKAFSGYAEMSDYLAAATQLTKDLADPSLVQQGVWYFTGYDSPFKFWDRRNEVWLVAKP